MTTLTASRVRHSDRDVTLEPSFGVTTKSPRQESDACASQRRHTRDSETSRRETSRVRHCDSDVTPLAIKIALPFQRGRGMSGSAEPRLAQSSEPSERIAHAAVDLGGRCRMPASTAILAAPQLAFPQSPTSGHSVLFRSCAPCWRTLSICGQPLAARAPWHLVSRADAEAGMRCAECHRLGSQPRHRMPARTDFARGLAPSVRRYQRAVCARHFPARSPCLCLARPLLREPSR